MGPGGNNNMNQGGMGPGGMGMGQGVGGMGQGGGNMVGNNRRQSGGNMDGNMGQGYGGMYTCCPVQIEHVVKLPTLDKLPNFKMKTKLILSVDPQNKSYISHNFSGKALDNT